ncbi:MAG: peptidoglycan DD-metalloendopeptidase family protein, partial [Mycoplasmatales bacterium]
FVVILINSVLYNNLKLDVNTSSISYVYKNDKLQTAISGSENINSLTVDLNQISEAKQGEVLNTNVVNSSTIFVEKDTNPKNIEKIVSDVKTLVPGYSVKIDDKPMYVANLDDYYDAMDEIFKSLLPNDELYSKYKATGFVPSFTNNNKRFTDIKVESNVVIKEDLVDGDQILSTKDDVVFYLLHGKEEKIVSAISPTTSAKDIQLAYGLTDSEIKLNNNGLDNSTLLYDGQELIVNKVNSQIKIATYYEEDILEPIPFHTQRVDNEDMPEGDENTLQEGRDGTKVVTYKTKNINYNFDSITAIKSEVIERSEDLIIEVGTKSLSSSGSSAPKFATGVLAWPSSGGVICGWYCYSGHAAIDISAWFGAPIYAADSGYVTQAGWYGAGGNTVIIDHQNGMTTTYMHMTSAAVSSGSYVSKGQVIGYEGSTGYVTTNHLHFVVRINGVTVNPMNFFY